MSDDKKKISFWPFIAAAGVVIGSVSISIGAVHWQGNATLHTLMETVATTLALLVSPIALIRYYSQKEPLYLFIGTGFFGAAFLDGYHAVVSSAFFAPLLPSSLSSMAPWSWTAPRLFLSVLIFTSWLTWWKQIGPERIRESAVYLYSGFLTLAVFIFFIFIPPPAAYYPDFSIPRPGELIPGIFFLLALIGYFRKGAWRHDSFECWLIIFLLLNAGIHLIVMPFSEQLFDIRFDMAHLLKAISYLCILTGLFISAFHIFRQSKDNAQLLAMINASMQQEIDERKRAEAKLEDSFNLQKSMNRKLNAVINTVIDGVILIDENGIVKTFNPAAAQLFGYRPDEVIGQNVKMLMPQSYAQNHDQFLTNYKKTGQAKIIGIGREVAGRKKNGDEFPIELSVGETEINQAPCFVGVIHDITYRKLAEQERQKNINELQRSNKELEQFAYIASHDLQEPLRMVSSYCDLLERRYRDQLDQDASDFIGFAADGARRMQNLVSDLLKFSRAGRDNIEFADVDLNEMMLTIHHSLEKLINESQATIKFGKLPVVFGSQSQLAQVFQNLLQNAIKFRREEPPVISIDVKKNKGMWKFTVRDNGIGIDEKFFDRVFLIFQRLHTRDDYEGTGIGLAITKRIIERHGGQIWLEKNKNGSGATFAFTLPFNKAKRS